MRLRTLIGVLAAVAAATPLATAAPAQPAHTSRVITLRMGEYFFTPKLIRAHVGDLLLVKNVGKIGHTAVDTKGGKILGVPLVQGGKSYRWKLTHAGTARFFCTLHPTRMAGRISVTR
jgi:plastocyanin